MSRYVVTGCAGFIGSHLVDRLLSDSEDVVGVDCFTDYYARSIKERNIARARTNRRFRLFELDLATDSIDDVVTSADGVFHLAAQAGVRASWEAFDRYTHNNVLATQRVFAAAAAQQTRVAFASTSAVYGAAERHPTTEDVPPRPISPYGVTKLSCEHLAYSYAEAFGLDVVTLRYFSVFGPRQRPDMAFTRILTSLVTGRMFRIYGTGQQSRDFTYVDDAVAATIAAMKRGSPGGLYNVGGGSETTLAAAIGIAERLAGQALNVEYVHAAAGDAPRTSSDTELARRDLGWRPQTTLADGLARQFEHVLEMARD